MRTINFPTLKITSRGKQQEALAETYYPLVACRESEAIRSGAFPGRKERSEGISLIAYEPPPKLFVRPTVTKGKN
jgi:hypothetical protein